MSNINPLQEKDLLSQGVDGKKKSMPGLRLIKSNDNMKNQ